MDDLSFLAQGGRHYVKFRIGPWGNLNLHNSRPSGLKGKTKKLFLRGLWQIFQAWETQLEKLGQPYFLKIWLYLPHVHASQVVVAVGGARDFYGNTFHLLEKEMRFLVEQVGHIGHELAQLNWQAGWDEFPLDDLEIDQNASLPPNIRLETWTDKNGQSHCQAYQVKGKIWIGGR